MPLSGNRARKAGTSVSKIATRLFLVVQTFAGNRLSAAGRAALDVATGNVQLALDDTAIVARLRLRTPILGLGSVAHARVRLALDVVCKLLLRRLYFFRPAFDHFLAAIDHEALFHGSSQCRMRR